MITEMAQIEIREGEAEAFEAAVARAVPIFLAADGCHDIRLVRSEELPTRYRLLVEWETVEHHTETFRGSEGFARWRELAGGFFVQAPQVEHVRDVLPG
ncbi:antibiotic biosynthesis monooxygenase [Pseudonocardia ailaonensis]|uniref:Antibiotic biosynthesis monooxygenase n=1 Tax=Pseudonocardia ailaonensis TaxID=367279 RepID=A0ABN2NH29_9PSEU